MDGFLPDIPQFLQDATGWVLGVGGFLGALFGVVSFVVRRWTGMRRSIREERIASRSEGWGGKSNPDQDLLDESPALPELPPLADPQELPQKLPQELPRGDSSKDQVA
jgi:hypothetical protein